jgi:hypothetical protein
MGLLAKLDRFVHVTRLDFMTPHAQRRPRNLRWLPIAVLAALVAGYAIQIGAARGAGWSALVGFFGSLLFFGAVIAANLIRLFGPRLAPDAAGPLDERERMLNARATAVSGVVIGWLVVLACFYFAFAATFRSWMPTSAVEWAFLGVGVQAAALALPVLVASWLQPALEEEE